MAIAKTDFGVTSDGQKVDRYILNNACGRFAKIITYGGIITELWMPDRKGILSDIVLGFDNLADYEAQSPYFGCITGRYANRIAEGRFTLDGVEYKDLAVNNGPNHLHGGIKGFDKVVWEAHPFETAEGVALKLHYLSKDMEEGYPGNLDVTVTYTLTDADELKIEYAATTDKPTVCNLTNHSYFNLAGQGQGDHSQHRLMINADAFTPVWDEGAIPTGEILAVRGTPMDFTHPTAIGLRIDDDYDQLQFGNGYDHNYVLNKKGLELLLAARVSEPTTGRVMECCTTEPGVQFYSGNYLDDTLVGKEGKRYGRRFGFCLETQHYPDSPNKPDFPSTVVRPGQKFRSTTIFKFFAE